MTEVTTARAIPFFDYRRAFAAYTKEFTEIFGDVLARGAFIQQRDLAEFEARLADYLGVAFAVGVGNGTDGLVMALRAAGIRPGDEVVLPSHTMVATAAAVVHCGGVPVPVECGGDHLVDPESVARAVTRRTRFVVPVHLNGRTCDMDALGAIAVRHELTIIEDAAQAIGSKFKGRYAGTFGRAGAFSFYPAKILGCLGDGGAIVTDDANVARQARLLRDHGRDETGETCVWGFNSRLDNLQAAFLGAQLSRLPAVIDRRRAIARRYGAALADVGQLVLPPGPDTDSDRFDVFQNYELEAERRDDLRHFLESNGVGTLVQWGGRAVHQFAALAFSVHLPVTERLFARSVMLPLNGTISDSDVDYICHLIRAFYGC